MTIVAHERWHRLVAAVSYSNCFILTTPIPKKKYEQATQKKQQAVHCQNLVLFSFFSKWKQWFYLSTRTSTTRVIKKQK